MLIAIDGIDGAGKTTLAESLVRLLGPLDPLLEKEPTEYSEWGRRLKKSAEIGRLSREEEIEYFHKDRLNHLNTVIVPAIDSGRVVILDRYVDSTLAYQSSSPEEAEELYQTFLPDIVIPNLTLILDCPAEVGLKRISDSRNGNSTFEVKDTLKLAQSIYESREGQNYVHIDAQGTKVETLKLTVKVLRSKFRRLRSVLPTVSRTQELGNLSNPDNNLSCGVVSA